MIRSIIKFHNFFVCSLLLVGVYFFASQAQAQVIMTDGALTVEFESTPLFSAPSEINIVPSSTSSKSVIVTNTGTVPEAVIVNVTNEYSTGLADAVSLTITDVSTGDVYFDDTMSNFFLEVPVGLGVLNANNTRSYDLATKFLDGSGNIYQASTLGFDIHFGFASGASVTPGGGGGGSATPGVPNTTNPPGQVAGDSVSIENGFDTAPAWWTPFTDWVTTAVLGESISQGEDGAIEGEVNDESGDVLGITDDIEIKTVPEAQELEERCLVIWLLLLALIAFVVISIDDLWSYREKVLRRLYIKHVLFLLVYVVAVGLVFLAGWLDSIWYVLVGAWVAMQAVDYHLHAKEWMLWKPNRRLLTYGALGIISIIIFLVFDWLCTWWPFALVAVASFIVYLFRER